MFYITPAKLIALRNDPFELRTKEKRDESHILEPNLLSILTTEKHLFPELFLIQTERPDKKGVEFVETFAQTVNSILDSAGEVSTEQLELVRKALLIKHNLPSNFQPDDELKKYQDYLFGANDTKKIITKQECDLLSNAIEKAQRILALPGGNMTIPDEYSMTNKKPYSFLDGKIKLYANSICHTTLKVSTIKENVEIGLVFDHLLIEDKNATVTNLIAMDNILDFSSYYRHNGLDLMAGLQRLFLTSKGLEPSITWLASDADRQFVFKVANFPDMNAELFKAQFHPKTGDYRLPYEFLQSSYGL